MDKRRMCPNCRAFITTDDKTCPYCDVPMGPRAIDRRAPADVLGGLIPHARFTTTVILLINFGIYGAMLLHHPEGAPIAFDPGGQTLYEFGAKYPPAIFGGQWWRLITAGFLHGGIFHILMNSWALFDLGAQVEEAYGTNRYVFFYILTTITGFLASSYWSPALSVGSSAPIFGLIGAMIALGIRDRSAYGTAVRSLYMKWAMYGLVMGLLPGIDNSAHLGGLAGGFVAGYLAGTPGFKPGVEKVWQVLSWVAMAVAGYAFYQMFLFIVASSRA